MNPADDTVLKAVMDESERRVQALIAARASLEERDNRGQTPLILAAQTDQFQIAEDLILGGADIFATSRSGWTVGYAAQTSRLAAGPDAQARDRVLAILQQRRFPLPAPHPLEVAQMVKDGAWPPRPAP